MRDLMPRQRRLHKRQAALRVRAAIDTGTRHVRVGVDLLAGNVPLVQNFADDLPKRGMVRNEEVVGLRRPLEALLTAPGHVLDGDEGAIGDEEEVEEAVANDDVLGAVDDGGERTESAGNTLVAVGKKCWITADGIVGWRSVNRLLDIGSVEVVVWA